MFGGYAGRAPYEWRLIPGFILSVAAIVGAAAGAFALVAKVMS